MLFDELIHGKEFKMDSGEFSCDGSKIRSYLPVAYQTDYANVQIWLGCRGTKLAGSVLRRTGCVFKSTYDANPMPCAMVLTLCCTIFLKETTSS